MKQFALLLLVSLSAAAQDKRKSIPTSCIIVSQHHHKFGEDANRWTRHKPFDYIEGDYPTGMKFKSELGDKDIQAIRDQGGKVVVIPQDHKLEDLKDAREQCQK